MRETNFIKQNKEKWLEFEQILEQDYKDPDKLNDLFVQITDDLSYSRTFYSNRSVRVYLNGLAQRIFFSIYKIKKSRRNRLVRFWTDELPQLVYESKGEFLLALFIFLLCFGIGMLSCAMDPDFVRMVLSDNYVDMTLENIESGDPMAVYKQRGELGMSVGITLNNIYVAFQTFVTGVFWGIGTVWFLVKNAVMVGAFQFFFVQQGLFWESFLTIWIHGTLEISAIIIAGAAGLTMAKGMVFPGTLSRMKAFQISSRRGVKIMIGIVPIFIIAGFLEGFLTRHTEVPDAIRGFFILACLIFVIGYFVVYPWLKAKRGFEKGLHDTKLLPSKGQKINLSSIKSSGQIFSDVFLFFRRRTSALLWTAFGVSAVYCLSVFLMALVPPNELFYFQAELFSTVNRIQYFFVHDNIPFLFWINTFLFSVLGFCTLKFFLKDTTSLTEPIAEGKTTFKKSLFEFLKIFIAAICLQGIFLTNDWYTSFLVLIFGPHLFLWMFVSLKEGKNSWNALARANNLASGNYSRMIGLAFILLIMGILFLLLMDTGVIYILLSFIGMNFSFDAITMDMMAVILQTFATIFLMNLIGIMLLTSYGLLYHTLLEIREAPHLKERIKYIGEHKSIRGLAREV